MAKKITISLPDHVVEAICRSLNVDNPNRAVKRIVMEYYYSVKGDKY